MATMKSLFPLCLLVSPNFKSWDVDRYSDIIRQVTQNQQQLIRSLTRISANFVISIRYIYDPNNSTKLHTYILVNNSSQAQYNEQYDYLLNVLTKGVFGNFYTLNTVDELGSGCRFDWVRFIGEVFKYEEFIQVKNLYIPYIIKPLPNNDMQAVCDVIRRLDNKIILEITLQTVDSRTHFWYEGINQIVTQLEEVKRSSSQDGFLDIALHLYREYQRFYPHGDIVEFSIKALAEKRSDALLVLHTLVEHASETTHHGKQCPIIVCTKGEQRFQNTLKATEEIKLAPLPEWQGWQKEIGQMYIKDAIAVNKTLRELFDDGSMNIHRPSLGTASREKTNFPNSGDIVLSNSSFLSNLSSTPQKARIADLQPLSHLATTQEITGFFRIPIPRPEQIKAESKPVKKITESLELEDIINCYSNLITEDSYVVGIAEDGSPCISDWGDIPHRIIAGVPGTGKTNFIKSIIYQFLYANSQREICIADFQAGMHYQLIVDLHPSLRMVTDLKEFAKLLGELWNEHETRRELMRTNRVTSLARLKDKVGIQMPRKVLIIDEAAFILSAERTVKAEIDKHLTNLAAQSRVTGIHLIYCSQRPTPEVIPRLISDNMDERVIFRVQSAASVMLLDNDAAANLPVKPKGRAVYRGLEEGLKVVATPYVPDEIWENSL